MNKYKSLDLLFGGVMFLGVLLSILLIYFEYYPWYNVITVFLFVFICTKFYFELGKKINFLTLISVLAVLQWLIGPMIYFWFYGNKDIEIHANQMVTTPEEYFGMVIPGTITLMLGLSLKLSFQRDHNYVFERARVYLRKKSGISVLMVIVGFFLSSIYTVVPQSLSFLVYMLGQIMYVGAFYLIVARKNILIMFAILGLLSFSSLVNGMFGHLVYWVLFFFIMLSVYFKLKARHKMIIMFVGVILITFIQLIKIDYRMIVWKNEDASKIEALKEVVTSKFSDEEGIFKEIFIIYNIQRLNQGSMISRVMDYVPDTKPHAHGKTVVAATVGSFIPRFLWPNKPVAGRELCREYTGLKLTSASMGLTPLGEGYVNFGKTGAIIFMFFYGLVFNFVFNGFFYFSKKIPSVILWMPVVFIEAIKVETDLLRTVNYMTKGLMFMVFCYIFARVVFKIRL